MNELMIIDPDTLNADDWKSILDLAVQLDDSGLYASDNEPAVAKVKCVIMAYTRWLESLGEVTDSILH